jgi:hypothetical protein
MHVSASCIRDSTMLAHASAAGSRLAGMPDLAERRAAATVRILHLMCSLHPASPAYTMLPQASPRTQPNSRVREKIAMLPVV